MQLKIRLRTKTEKSCFLKNIKSLFFRALQIIISVQEITFSNGIDQNSLYYEYTNKGTVIYA